MKPILASLFDAATTATGSGDVSSSLKQVGRFISRCVCITVNAYILRHRCLNVGKVFESLLIIVFKVRNDRDETAMEETKQTEKADNVLLAVAWEALVWSPFCLLVVLLLLRLQFSTIFPTVLS